MRILAFDFGIKHIGVAVGQTITQTAEPLTTLVNNPEMGPEIKKLLAYWSPQKIIIGLPLNMDGSEQELTLLAKHFADTLQAYSPLSIEWVDENLSTWEAKQALNLPYRGKITKNQAQQLNAQAAVIIAEDWLKRSTSTSE
ncbi:MAG: Holliday junction resolvase RuvX [Gammaproteobacteria bacterium]